MITVHYLENSRSHRVPWLLRPTGIALSKGIQNAWLNKQLALHGRVIEQHLSQHRYFAGTRFSIADVQMSFPLLALQKRSSLRDMPAIARWLEGMQAPPGNVTCTGAGRLPCVQRVTGQGKWIPGLKFRHAAAACIRKYTGRSGDGVFGDRGARQVR